MATSSYATPQDSWVQTFPNVWNLPNRSPFGDLVLILFLLAQFFDGVFTYVGVMTYGIGIEANPLLSALMLRFGEEAALIGAKLVASALGIALHLRRVHTAVALLTLFYLAVAIIPWTAILLD